MAVFTQGFITCMYVYFTMFMFEFLSFTTQLEEVCLPIDFYTVSKYFFF